MQAIKDMGYDGVELAGLYGLESAVACKKILDEVGLELVSAHIGFDVLEDDAVAARHQIAVGVRAGNVDAVDHKVVHLGKLHKAVGRAARDGHLGL